MGITQTFYDAAHKYGLDNMSVTTSLNSWNQAVLGGIVSTTNSWTGNILVGQPGTSTIALAGGFTEMVNFVYTNTVNGSITGVSLYKAETNELLLGATGSVPFTVATWGTALQSENVFAGNDTINGNTYNNSLKGYGGSDRIDGGAGTDTVYFTGLKAQYQITKSGTAISVSGPDGADTLLNVERLHFDDFTLAFDLNSNAGQAYRLYQAALNRTPDKPGLGAQIGGLDSGMPLLQIAQNFMDSPEFKLKYGANLSNSGFVTQLYSNVLHRAPDASGFAHQLGALDNNAASRAQLLVNFSESPENQAALIGVIQNGIEYQI